MKLYDYIDILHDEWVIIVQNGYSEELKKDNVKKEYENNIITKICTDCSPSGDGSILTFVYIK